ncbi:hypothetical protein QL093DRAFT_2525136 [Fusarium oxysporum]|nr:hypothetical protein QL093DRAFT_2525136 [Fusarium oxysporum]
MCQGLLFHACGKALWLQLAAFNPSTIRVDFGPAGNNLYLRISSTSRALAVAMASCTT